MVRLAHACRYPGTVDWYASRISSGASRLRGVDYLFQNGLVAAL